MYSGLMYSKGTGKERKYSLNSFVIDAERISLKLHIISRFKVITGLFKIIIKADKILFYSLKFTIIYIFH